VLQMPRIEAERRVPEREFFRELDRLAGRLYGALLDGLVVALRDAPGLVVEELPRMADFAKIGMAIAPLLGISGDEFLRAYSTKRKEGSSTLVEESVLRAPIEELLAGSAQGVWSGNTSELAEALRETAAGGAVSERLWPKNARALSAQLNRIAPDLRTTDVADVTGTLKTGLKMWTLRRVSGK
jgi:hypothetical protein